MNRYRKPNTVNKRDSRGSTHAETEDGCKICTNAFDDLNLVQIELACGHFACHECALGIWLRTSSLNCPFRPGCASLHDDSSEEGTVDFLADDEHTTAETKTSPSYEDEYACCGYECLASEGLVKSFMSSDVLGAILKPPKRSIRSSWWSRLSGIPYGL